jgi:hypothetical protein
MRQERSKKKSEPAAEHRPPPAAIELSFVRCATVADGHHSGLPELALSQATARVTSELNQIMSRPPGVAPAAAAWASIDGTRPPASQHARAAPAREFLLGAWQCQAVTLASLPADF